MKIEMFPLLILLFSVYNIFYGSVCWRLAGFNGLLIGSIMMALGTLIGVLLRNCMNCENKHKEKEKINT